MSWIKPHFITSAVKYCWLNTNTKILNTIFYCFFILNAIFSQYLTNLSVNSSSKQRTPTQDLLHRRQKQLYYLWEMFVSSAVVWNLFYHITAWQKTYYQLTFHIAYQVLRWRSWCIAWSVSRCLGFVTTQRHKRQPSKKPKKPKETKQSVGSEPTGRGSTAPRSIDGRLARLPPCCRTHRSLLT